MPGRYDQLFSALARRAVRQGVVDIETFAERALASGMSPENLEERLLQDLEQGGPVFGKFTRSLGGAASSAVLAAEKQGEAAARAYAEELISLSELDDLLEDADPEQMAEIAAMTSSRVAYTWVATLINTCHLCLPLHGKTMTREQWEADGLDPETIHIDEGWESKCQCQLIPSEDIDDPGEVREPLMRERVKSPMGQKVSGRTKRAIAQHDPEKAIDARDKAMETLEGRRTMRLMGQMNADKGDDDE